MTPNRVVRPRIFQSIPGLVAGVSTRHGGLSEYPYSSLNLGIHTDDTPEIIEQNVALFCEDLGISPADLARSYQVHGDKIWVTGRAGYQSGFDAVKTACATDALCDWNLWTGYDGMLFVVNFQNNITAGQSTGWYAICFPNPIGTTGSSV